MAFLLTLAIKLSLLNKKKVQLWMQHVLVGELWRVTRVEQAQFGFLKDFVFVLQDPLNQSKELFSSCDSLAETTEVRNKVNLHLYILESL